MIALIALTSAASSTLLMPAMPWLTTFDYETRVAAGLDSIDRIWPAHVACSVDPVDPSGGFIA
jgi:hypothetical protein